MLKPEEVSSFYVLTSIVKWVGWLFAIILFNWFFMPYIDKWVMTLLGIWR